ncbi:MAG: preprotein translocase subunit SecE [Chloroflexota bacterium]
MTKQLTAAKRGGARFTFISETIAELKKVVWLTRQEATYLTFLVLVVAAAVGVVLGVLDFAFSRLVDGVLLPR